MNRREQRSRQQPGLESASDEVLDRETDRGDADSPEVSLSNPEQVGGKGRGHGPALADEHVLFPISGVDAEGLVGVIEQMINTRAAGDEQAECQTHKTGNPA